MKSCPERLRACLQRKANSGPQAHVGAQHGDTLKVVVHLHTALGVGVHVLSSSVDQADEAIYIPWLGSLEASQQLAHTPMHQLCTQYLLAVQLANELDIS